MISPTGGGVGGSFVGMGVEESGADGCLLERRGKNDIF